MKVTIKQIEGITFIGKGETNHWIIMDGPEEHHGSAAASRPMELLLLSLGSCSGSDVASILRKKHVELDEFEIHVTGERTEQHPKVFTHIHVEYLFYGNDLDEKHLKRAIELSQDKYCPVAAMLRKSCDLTHSYQMKSKK